MHLLKRFRDKKVQGSGENQPEEIIQLVESALEKREVNLEDEVERKLYIEEQCKQIRETTVQMEEFAAEYEVVTSNLTDIQRIDSIPLESRGDMTEYARQILTLTRERNRIQSYHSNMNPRQYKTMEENEDSIPDEVRKINEKESYMNLLKQDLAHLEGEKSTIRYEQAIMRRKQEYLKKTSIVFLCLTAVLFMIFYSMDRNHQLTTPMPVLIGTLFVVVSIAYILKEGRNNQYQMKLLHNKQNRAMGLLNTVKIKYVNNRCSLDYSYNKYEINHSAQLTAMWEEYLKIKEANRKYSKNTESLVWYEEALLRELANFQIKDREIWISQCVALVDPREMVEIRHRLNVRRQKLRDRLDYNQRMKEESLQNIDQVLRKKPVLSEEIREYLIKYQVAV